MIRAVAVILMAVVSAGDAKAQQTAEPKQVTAATIYSARYHLAGFLLRAGAVCSVGTDRLVSVALNFVASEELKAVSKAFPATTEKWMTEGAETFNREVMTKGMRPACERALAEAESAGTAIMNAQNPPKPRWVSVEAANSAVIKVDMKSIQRTSGGAVIWTYADEGRPEDPYNLKGYFFDCKGHYVTMELMESDWIDAPPRSAAAQIQALACRHS